MSHTITFTGSHTISGASFFAGPSSSSSEKENFSISQKETDQSQAPIDRILHDDVLSLIFRFATQDGRDPKTLCAIRAVNRRWYCLLDTRQLDRCWQRLEQEVPHPILARTISMIGRSSLNPMIADPSEHSDLSDCDESECDQLAPSLVSTHFSRFVDLTQTLREKDALIPPTHTVIGFELSSYEDVQQHLDDTALTTIWTKVQQRITFGGAPIPSNAEAIREWLKSPINADKIACITGLDLSKMNLNILPSEIGLFSRLRALNLSENRLTRLPSEIGNLFQLTMLNLSQNQLTNFALEICNLSQLYTLNFSGNELASLPDSIGNLSELNSLGVSANRLASLPDTIGNLSELDVLHLSANRLTNLPYSIGSLSRLTHLSLDNNELTSLPDTIGKLSQLEVLSLPQNQLTTLPYTIGKLSRLIVLDIFQNRLTTLPSTFGKLRRLKLLDLSENRLTNLPPSFGKLPKLETLFLNDNLLIFTLDKNLKEFDKKKRLIVQNETSKLLACSNYACRTPLAALCQHIHRGAEDKPLKTAFEQLSNELQRHIYATWATLPSSSSEAGADFFADRTNFIRAVIKTTQDKWQSLCATQRNHAYVNVAYLARQPREGALEWGEAHAEENIIRFIDAMELALKAK